MHGSRLSACATVLLGLFAALPGSATACGTGKLLFEDKFTQRPAWINPSADAAAGATGLIVREKTANGYWLAGPPQPYANVEVCVTVSAQSGSADQAAAGISFFFHDTNTFYRAMVSNISGEFAVERRLPTQWSFVLPYLTNPAVRKGPTADNEISVKISGTHVLMLLNDKPVAEFDGAVAYVNDTRSSYAGLAWVTYDSNAPHYAFVFKNLQIREPQ